MLTVLEMWCGGSRSLDDRLWARRCRDFVLTNVGGNAKRREMTALQLSPKTLVCRASRGVANFDFQALTEREECSLDAIKPRVAP
ncbi:MAG: hypothetical protein EXQ47_11760 [Bryobacterales bacterium]|nr:hypothetical protein [Bryobacterales bacterium]